MEIVLNMFVALCVGISYVVGYLLAALSLILLVSWIIDDRYKTTLSNDFIDLLKLYLPEENKGEKVACRRCEDVKTMDIGTREDNYCSLCGKKLKKSKSSAHDTQIEKMTNKIVLFALGAIVLYTISTVLFTVGAVISIAWCCYYYLNAPKAQQRLS